MTTQKNEGWNDKLYEWFTYYCDEDVPYNSLHTIVLDALQTERQKREEMNKRKLLEDFAEYAHTRYNGCVNDGEWQYQYDTEVVCMIDDYLTQSNNPK